MQEERDSATDRASELQEDLTELHKDYEKLRKASMFDLHEKVCFGQPIICIARRVTALGEVVFLLCVLCVYCRRISLRN